MAASQTVLDGARLERLQTQLGQGRFERLMGRFEPASRVELDRLDAAAATNSLAAISAAAHRIAGFAANFGAQGLATLARELEAHPEEVKSIAPQLRAAIERTSAALTDAIGAPAEGAE